MLSYNIETITILWKDNSAILDMSKCRSEHGRNSQSLGVALGFEYKLYDRPFDMGGKCPVRSIWL